MTPTIFQAVSIDISGALGRPAAQSSECEKKFFFQKGDQ